MHLFHSLLYYYWLISGVVIVLLHLPLTKKSLDLTTELQTVNFLTLIYNLSICILFI